MNDRACSGCVPMPMAKTVDVRIGGEQDSVQQTARLVSRRYNESEEKTVLP